MDDAPVLTAEGRAFPVETRWLDRPRDRAEPARGRGGGACSTRCGETEGGVLVFLPGQARDRPDAAAAGAAACRTGWCFSRCMAGCLRRAARGAGAAGRAQAGAGDVDRRDLADHSRRAGRGGCGKGAAGPLRPGLGDDPARHRAGDEGRGRAAPRPCGAGGARLVLPALDPRRGGRDGGLPAAGDRQRRPGRPGARARGLGGGLAGGDVLPDAAAGSRLRRSAGAARRARGDRRRWAGRPSTADGWPGFRCTRGSGTCCWLRDRTAPGPLAADLAALTEARDPLRGAGADLSRRLDALRGADPALAAVRTEAKRLRALAPSGRGAGLSPGGVLSLAYPDRDRRSGGPGRRRVTCLPTARGRSCRSSTRLDRRRCWWRPTWTAIFARRRSGWRCR